ncbi:AMP-binding protein [Chitinivorax tropicus]|uniref:AMP-binding protein n=1 Tax=Chitinivorax tropicus TaxID=714531 RepID=UPI003CCD277E
MDTFTRDGLPPPDQLPECLFDLPELQFPSQVNCAAALLDDAVHVRGWGDRVALRFEEGGCWTYRMLLAQANRIAQVLREDMGLVAGNRVLLRGANHPMLAAAWFGVVKAGGVAVTTMPLLRAKELRQIVQKARISHAICEASRADELQLAAMACPDLQSVCFYHDESAQGLEALMASKDGCFDNVPTAADDACLIAFTSGTTGQPKATVHFHRDVLAICQCFPQYILRADATDVFSGSPPLGFTFGLGGLLLFPLSIGASTVLLAKGAPEQLRTAIAQHQISVLFTAPTAYRAMAAVAKAAELRSLRKCVSAGEVLPVSTRNSWRQLTGIELIDGIGATELLHIFVSADEQQVRPGATGKAIPGYQARVVDELGRPLPPYQVGRLAVKGPTGCRYLDDPRQADYVQGGWNLTGDAYYMDEDGYLFYQARVDDLIISAGYNIAPVEIEDILLQHPAVAECAVVGQPDADRNMVVCAHVVPRPGFEPSEQLTQDLQQYVKQQIAPYKYPRVIEYHTALPRNETGKLQRFRLRHAAMA